MFVLIILGLAVLYRYGPSRRLAKWRWISIGSVFASLSWLAVLAETRIKGYGIRDPTFGGGAYRRQTPDGLCSSRDH